MLFNYSKRTKLPSIKNYLMPIKDMLDKTWKLTGNFELPEDNQGKEVIETFNLFFMKLNTIVGKILKSIISLSSLSPRLLEFCQDFRHKFQEQSEKIEAVSDAGEVMALKTDEIAKNTLILKDESYQINKEVKDSILLGEKSMEQINEISGFVDSLADTIAVLSGSSKSIENIIEVMNNIADETNLLSLNARIEASSASAGGKGFAVIAQEISKLAKQSKSASDEIRDQLFFLQDKINETVDSVDRVKKNVSLGREAVSGSNRHLLKVDKSFDALLEKFTSISNAVNHQNINVKKISDDLKDMKKLVEYQVNEVGSIADTSEKINSACSEIILSSGVFHLENHEKAVLAAGKIGMSNEMKSFERYKMESVMKKSLLEFSFIELLYVTDLSGNQVTANIYSNDVELSKVKEAFGENWSGKEWFYKIKNGNDIFVSNVYRSSATSDFCFTVSLPVVNKSGERVGVLGVDINFGNILNV